MMFSSTPKPAFLLRCLTVTLLIMLLGSAVLPAQDGKLEPRPASGDGGKGDPKGDGGGGDGPQEGDQDDRDPQDAESCSFATNELAAIRDVDVVGSNLEIAIAWSSDPVALPPWANLELQDELGGPVASLNLSPVAGTITTQSLGLTATQVDALGPQYRLVLEDPFAVPLAPALDFRLTIDCNSGPCVLRSVDGLRAGWVAISSELMLAIDGAQGALSTDILGDVATTEPMLRGEVLSLAWQLDRLDDVFDLDAEPCTCLWVPSRSASPDEEGTEDFSYNDSLSAWPPTPSYATAGQDGPGAAYELAIQHTGGQIMPGVPFPFAGVGFSQTVMDLRCWSVGNWAPSTDPDWSEFPIEVPQLSSCVKGCKATIRHQIEAWGAMEAEAWGTYGQSASAGASFAANWQIDGDEHFDASGNLLVKAQRDGATTDLTCTHKAGDQTVIKVRSTSKLATTSSVSAEASEAGPDQGWAFANSALSYWMESSGRSQCAIVPYERISLTDEKQDLTEVEDEILMERWGP